MIRIYLKEECEGELPASLKIKTDFNEGEEFSYFDMFGDIRSLSFRQPIADKKIKSVFAVVYITDPQGFLHPDYYHGGHGDRRVSVYADIEARGDGKFPYVQQKVEIAAATIKAAQQAITSFREGKLHRNHSFVRKT